jgi:hypothetical protein
MRSSVSKSAGQGVKGLQNPVMSLKNTTMASAHPYVGLFLTFTQL